MKGLICSFLMICFAKQIHSKPPFFEGLHEFRDVCLQELGLSEAAMMPPTRPSSGNPSDRPEPNHDVKCLMNCLLRKANFVDANGKLQRANLKVSADIIEVVMNECADITDSDPCQQIYLMDECIKQHLPRPTPASA